MNSMKYYLPYSKYDNHMVVECFIVHSKSFFIIDLNISYSSLNAKYYDLPEGNKVVIPKMNCFFVRKQNKVFRLEKYQNDYNNKVIKGVLGNDFFEEYQLIKNNTEEHYLVFASIDSKASMTKVR